eukprot:scaffold324_cov394-Prasinococcus_capsulatus_cf.AAC.15
MRSVASGGMSACRLMFGSGRWRYSSRRRMRVRLPGNLRQAVRHACRLRHPAEGIEGASPPLPHPPG